MKEPTYCWMVNDYIDDELRPDDRIAFEQHLGKCLTCQRELEGLLAIQYRIASLPKNMQPKRDLWDGIEASFHPQPQPLTSGLEERKNGRAVILQSSSRLQVFNKYILAAAVILVLAAVGVVWIILNSDQPQQLSSVRQPDIQPQLPAMPESITEFSDPAGGTKSTPTAGTAGKALTQRGGRGISSGNRKPTRQEGNAFALLDGEMLDQRLQRGLNLDPTPLQPSSPGKIIGSVLDERGKPMFGMTVEIVGGSRSALTNKEGEFEFFGLTPEMYSLQVGGMGYQQKIISGVKIIPGFTTQVKFYLASGSISLKDVAMNKEHFLAQSGTSLSLSEIPLASYVQPPVHSNKLTIEGRVVDERGRSVVGAVVLVLGTRRGAYSDYEGKFHIYGVPGGTYTLQAIAQGYQKKDTTNVEVSLDVPREINIALDTEVIP